ncbi:hypothetical protein DNK47_03085 [Mycoplasma wenyonii]|uniref:Uncharacterized protein n=1 Tax=Mycoplasma wenyonii TaxID=65123 RepID=A0A328PP56_9MOLU|nr:hypothetical protein [Mycoplasma wenyonii]RAO94798.1 hypothetical protein DNK47_03085 [Mycoplasma wenyonii]
MSFFLFPGLAHFALTAVVIGGGGTALVKSIQGSQIVVSTSATTLTNKVSHQVTERRTETLSSSVPADTKDLTSSLSTTSQTEKPIQELQKIEEQKAPVKEENCQITKHLSDIPESFRAETQDYVTISCSDRDLNPFPFDWKGLFPRTIFKTGEQLNEGQELIIKIRDKEEELTSISENTSDEEDFKITISSPQFSTTDMTATWNYSTEDSSWAVISVADPTLTQKIYLLLNEEEQAGNCEIVDSLNQVPESFSSSLGSYFSLSCGVSGVDTFPDPIKVLFPKNLFKNQNKLTVGKKFDLKIETDMDGEQESAKGFGITFSSDQFSSSSINGTWDYDESDGAVVKLQDNKQIYLLLRED